MSTTEHILVVGAGISGLWLTSKLAAMGKEVICLEASNVCGGRIKSVYDDNGNLLYEAGPWRIPETHKRVLQLFREHSISLGPLRTPTLPKTKLPNTVPGLSVWDVNALTHGAILADQKDLETGYADQTHCASGSAPYITNASRYFIANNGFSLLITSLKEGHDIRLDHRVVNIVREQNGYNVEILRRIGHNSFERTNIYTNVLFVCVPPNVCRHWSIFTEHAKSVMNAVEEGQLHHIYMNHEMPCCNHYRNEKSLLSQSISSQYGNRWFQASYSGGRIARFWHNLNLSNPRLFKQRICEEVSRLWKKTVKDGNIKSHFWEVAFHHWKTVPNFSLQRAVKAAIRPSPHQLPNVYIAGEAFSSYQAWMEGALETAELALKAYQDPFYSVPCLSSGEIVVFVEGYPIDVTSWAKVHPGSEIALRNHNGEDVTELMNHIHHSPHAWAVVHSLKCV